MSMNIYNDSISPAPGSGKHTPELEGPEETKQIQGPEEHLEIDQKTADLLTIELGKLGVTPVLSASDPDTATVTVDKETAKWLSSNMPELYTELRALMALQKLIREGESKGMLTDFGRIWESGKIIYEKIKAMGDTVAAQHGTAAATQLIGTIGSAYVLAKQTSLLKERAEQAKILSAKEDDKITLTTDTESAKKGTEITVTKEMKEAATEKIKDIDQQLHSLQSLQQTLRMGAETISEGVRAITEKVKHEYEAGKSLEETKKQLIETILRHEQEASKEAGEARGTFENSLRELIRKGVQIFNVDGKG